MIRSPVTRNLAVGIATAALMVAAASMASAQNNGTVSGVIYDVDGQPVAGAMVKLKNDQRRLDQVRHHCHKPDGACPVCPPKSRSGGNS